MAPPMLDASISTRPESTPPLPPSGVVQLPTPLRYWVETPESLGASPCAPVLTLRVVTSLGAPSASKAGRSCTWSARLKSAELPAAAVPRACGEALLGLGIVGAPLSEAYAICPPSPPEWACASPFVTPCAAGA